MKRIINKKALYDYQILDTYEAGVILTGPEVKSVKGGRISLEGSFVRIVGSEIYLVNAQIYPYEYARQEGYDPKRTRKLLMHKKEIISLKTKVQSQALTLVPVECFTIHGFIKLKIGLARGKKVYDKREKIKRRDIDRQVHRELREKF